MKRNMAAVELETKGPPQTERKDQGAPEIPIAAIYTGGNIREVEPSSVRELADSIREQGVLEPVLLGYSALNAEKGAKPYVLVAGFRRVAAAKVAGLRTVPAQVRNLTKGDIGEIRLVENLQREDLSPLDEARALQAYLASTGATQAELGQKIGKSQPYVANRIRMLGLPEPVVKQLEAGKLTPSHAEAFLALPKEATMNEVQGLLERAVRDQPTLPQLEDAVRWKAGIIKDRTQTKNKWAAKLAKAKFPTCPLSGCGSKPQRGMDAGEADTPFSDRAGHRWSPRSGKVLPKIRSEPSVYQRAAEPPKPTLPLVDGKVPFELTPAELVWWLLNTTRVNLEDVSIRDWNGKMVFDIRGTKLDGVKLPGFRMGSRLGAGFVQLDGADEYSQRTDRERKRLAEQRAQLEEWVGRMAGKVAIPKAGAKPPAAPKAKKRRA